MAYLLLDCNHYVLRVVSRFKGYLPSINIPNVRPYPQLGPSLAQGLILGPAPLVLSLTLAAAVNPSAKAIKS
jgi:hypothetical protein